MKEYVVTKNDAGQRLDRFAAKQAPAVSSGTLQKYFRTKDIKINGHWARPDARVAEGDTVRLYLPDSCFAPAAEKSYTALASTDPKLSVVYEDENLLLVDKPQGVLCHAASGWSADTLIARIQAYVYQRGEWDPAAENSFAPALCNRIDRGTGGIVIAAKNAEALRILDEKIRLHEIDKYYLCVCAGLPDPPRGTLTGYIFKDAVKNTVYVRKTPEPGALSAVTEYRVLTAAKGLSLVECRLLTGRTHQIRAQMADAGHPLLGDSKYGTEKLNRRFGEKRQLLWSYKLAFDFKTDGGALQYLNGRVFKVDRVPFVQTYFSDIFY